MPVMKDTIKSATGEDLAIYIEVDDVVVEDNSPWGNTRGIIDHFQQAQEAFQKATTLIHTCAENIAQSIQSIPPAIKPQEFEAQFSVKLSAEWGAVLAKSGIEGQIQVTLKWSERDK